MAWGTIHPLLFGYVILFSLAAIVCFFAVRPLKQFDDTDTRKGLGWLLILSGLWSIAHLCYLLAPTRSLQYAFFVGGLVVGIVAVLPWLYFCSAYSGRTLHRDIWLRRGIAGLLSLIILIKITNPLHEWYFTATPTSTPFPYLAISHEPFHWVVMGLAYLLAGIGFFMLFEMLRNVSFDTTILWVIVALAGLPVVFDLLGPFVPALLELTHSPLGVAAFAVGAVYLYVDRFQEILITGGSENPVILLDNDEQIREANHAAMLLFPELANGYGDPLDEVLPALAARSSDPEPMLQINHDKMQRYYLISTSAVSADRAQLGQIISLTDVSEREQYRSQLERQNTRLENFASVVSHDLRNPLTVAKGRIDLALADETPQDHLEATMTALERMEELIEDLLLLARSGDLVDDLETIWLPDLIEESWAMINAPQAKIIITKSANFELDADPERLQQLCENLFRNAVEHGGQSITVTVSGLGDEDGFAIEDSGNGIPAAVRDTLFDPGVSSRPDGTGFGLSIVAEIVEAHGWSIEATDGSTGGARFEIRTA